MPRQDNNKIKIAKFKGNDDSVTITKWLRLYDVLAGELNWSQETRAKNFHAYLEEDAFNWYLNEIFDEVTVFDEIKERMIERFATSAGDPFRTFIHYRQAKTQSVKDYFEQKRRYGHSAELQNKHVISGLTDGLLPVIEAHFAGVKLNSTSEWLNLALQVESSVKRRERFQPKVQPSTSNANTSVKTESGGSKIKIKTETPAKPKTPCRICEVKGIMNQLHWHNECPNKPVVKNAESDSENDDSDPNNH